MLSVGAQGRFELNGGTVSAGAVSVGNGGSVVLAAGGGRLINATSIAIDSNPASRIDLADDAMVIAPANLSELNGITTLLRRGYSDGAWTGGGITSRIAATDASRRTALGMSFDGLSVQIRYSFYGDANLDGSVDTADFKSLAANFSKPDKFWFNGDFNYDGSVDTADFNLMASNFAQTLRGDAIAARGQLIPEPTSVAGSCVATLLIRARRRAGLR